MSNMVEKDNIISESGYSSLLETLYLLSDPTMKENCLLQLMQIHFIVLKIWKD